MLKAKPNPTPGRRRWDLVPRFSFFSQYFGLQCLNGTELWRGLHGVTRYRLKESDTIFVAGDDESLKKVASIE